MKIIEIIKKWFQNNKKTKVKMISEGQTKSIVENKKEFISNIDISGKQEILEIRKQLETGQVSVDDLSIFEVMDILELYGEHIPRID